MSQSNDYLQHWGIEKGGKKQNHKYYMRVDSGNPKNPYIYFYSREEYNAWLNKSTTNPELKKKAKIKEGILDRMRSIANMTLDQASKGIKTIKKAVDKDDNGRLDIADKIARAVDKNGNGKLDLVDRVENRKQLNKIKTATEKADKEQQERKARQDKERGAFQKNHAGKTSGHSEPPKNHKYIAKIEINGKFRYFYSESELAAYRNRTNSTDDGFDTFELIHDAQTEEESRGHINPNYKKNTAKDGFDAEPGWSNNCYSCALAYEARSRGYDVEAKYDMNGANLDEQSSFYEGVKSPFKSDEYGNQYAEVNKDGSIKCYQRNENSGWDYPSNSSRNSQTKGSKQLEQLSKDLNNKYEDGARGQLNVNWAGANGGIGGGHCMSWEKKDGDIWIHDTQNNTTEKMSEYSRKNNIASFDGAVVALRTDDKKLTSNAAEYLAPADDVDEAKGSNLVFTEKEMESYARTDGFSRINQKTAAEDYDTYKKMVKKASSLGNVSMDEINKELYSEDAHG